MTKDEAIEKAIDFLDGSYEAHAVRKVLQEALERPSYMVAVPLDKLEDMQRRLKKEWVRLSDDEISEIWWADHYDYIEFARVIEKALKEKNHATNI